jgi:hypothetical protein
VTTAFRKERLAEELDELNSQIKSGQKDRTYIKTLRGSFLTHAANEGISVTEGSDGTYSFA